MLYKKETEVASNEAKRIGWFPLRGSWEEAVLSWNEQIDIALRRQRLSPALSSKARSRAIPNGLDSSKKAQTTSAVG